MRLVGVLMRVHCAISVSVLVSVLVLVTVGVRMLVLVIVNVRVGVIVLVDSFDVGVLVIGLGDDVDLGSGEAAAHDFAAFNARIDVQGCNSVFEHGKWDASIDEGSEEHVAADAGEAFEIGNSHQEEL
jgi:hypothetical protein